MSIISGDSRIDALLGGADVRWNVGALPGTPVALTYSFMAKVPAYAQVWDEIGFSPFTTAQRYAVREILTAIQYEFGVSFEEVTETTENASPYGQLRFGNNLQTNTAAYAYLPQSEAGSAGGDVYVNNDPAEGLTTGVVSGTFAYSTLIHEIGHALGLRHPGNYNAADSDPPPADDGPYLTGVEDSELFSIMSYTGQAQGLQRVDYAAYDHAALAYLYGADVVATEDSIYRFSAASGRVVQTIVDGGGFDVLDASRVRTPVVINLHPAAPGELSSVGVTVDGALALNNLSIALDTVIEGAWGGSGDDWLIGNSSDNTLVGNAGNDTLVAGLGRDEMWGGIGSDKFGVTDRGDYVIEDFVPGEDYLCFDTALGVSSVGQVAPYVSSLVDTANGVLMTFVNDLATIELVGVRLSQLSPEMVSFEAL